MKKFIRVFFVLAIVVTVFAAIALTADATELKTGIGIVEASALRVREKPTTSSDIIATAHSGDAVIIIKEVDGWYLCSYNLKIGYVCADYVQFKEKENVKIGYASFDCASNVRSGPSTSTSIVKSAPKGETCFIIGFNCGWFKVSYNGNKGYVRSDLVTMLECPYSNYGSPGNTYKEPGGGSSNNNNSSSAGSKIVSCAKQYLGYRYVYGGSSPSTGFDCSGFAQYVFKQCGYTIGRTTTQQNQNGTRIANRSDLKPGDLVLFASGGSFTHTGIYIGNGQFIHASNSSTGVIISSLSESYYSARFACGRRIV